MPLEWQLTNELAHCDGLETVLLQPPRVLTTTPVAGALRRRALTREAAPSGGVVLAADAVWHLPAEAVAEAPLPGTRIIDGDGIVWTALAVEREAFGARWRCPARNLTLALGLEHIVQIEQATWSKDAAGAPVAQWNLVRAGMRARIQPILARHELRHAQRLERVTHDVYLAETMLLDEGHRILHEGVVYNVRGYTMAERLDEPTVIQVERVPWPWS